MVSVGCPPGPVTVEGLADQPSTNCMMIAVRQLSILCAM